MESLLQWRSQQQSDHHHHSAKIPKLHHHHHLVDQQSPPSSALPLFAPEPHSSSTKATNNSPDPLSAAPNKSPSNIFGFGGFFSVAQWQELELQALIYKYMLAGASVPLELISPIRRSLLTSSPLQYQLAMLQRGAYWGRCNVDPEPGRCRRTDGKKWRCSREVVTGQKYCERHVYRGRNRSRKHVEIPTTTTTTTIPDVILVNRRSPDEKEQHLAAGRQDYKPDCGVLRSFFDDWPRAQRELAPNSSSAASATHLPISNSGNCSSDFSLKLSTGNGEKPAGEEAGDRRPMANWPGWVAHWEVSMGGPLAEALRS